MFSSLKIEFDFAFLYPDARARINLRYSCSSLKTHFSSPGASSSGVFQALSDATALEKGERVV
jgi:hypothetical protein